jgi:hypothetical protein
MRTGYQANHTSDLLAQSGRSPLRTKTSRRSISFMTVPRFALPDPEEQDFIDRVNAKLPDGAKVHAFRTDSPEPHGMVMQYGSRRRAIRCASPFCHAAEDDIVAMVTEWVAGLAQRERWTTDERYAEGLI